MSNGQVNDSRMIHEKCLKLLKGDAEPHAGSQKCLASVLLEGCLLLGPAWLEWLLHWPEPSQL
jgi:hypothetical protein